MSVDEQPLQIATHVSPYTRHGHLVHGFSSVGWPRPDAIARCGGPAICSSCARDAETIQLAENETVPASSTSSPEPPPLPPQSQSRVADALADLADALVGMRELADRFSEQEKQRQAEEEAESGRREPAEWQEALGNVERWLARVQYDVTVTRRDIESGEAEKIVAALPAESAKRIVAELDRALRGGPYTMRYALRTLGGNPPKDLRREAEKFADRHGAEGPARAAAIEAYLAGAGVER